MSEPYIPSVSLHQQNGGMSVRAFAAQQGISLELMRHYIKAGRVVGAQQDARSKRWTIYPPAKLMDKEGDSMRPRSRKVRSVASIDAATECDAPRAAPPSGAGVMAACGHADTHPTLAVIEAAELLPASQQAPQGRAAGCSSVYRSTEVRSVCQALREAAARQHREGIHYLRLDAHEFAQLYAALDIERSRVRKLVGRKVLPVGVLRASDTVWQKMQAMCQQGRLL